MHQPNGLLCGALLLAVSALPGRAADTVDYNRDIKPLLSNSCYACHGPDESHREADLRLDVREAAVDDSAVIVPGEPGSSELLNRLTTDVEFLRMLDREGPRAGRCQLGPGFIRIDRFVFRAVITKQAFDVFHEPDHPDVTDQQRELDHALDRVGHKAAVDPGGFLHGG